MIGWLRDIPTFSLHEEGPLHVSMPGTLYVVIVWLQEALKRCCGLSMVFILSYLILSYLP